MKPIGSVSYLLLATMVLLSLAAIACAPAAPALAPTSAPAAPTKAVEPTKAATPPTTAAPTKAPTAAPTAAPAVKVNWPEKGKPITLIVPYGAGGSVDNSARSLAPMLEKELGTPVEIVNKAGGATQVGSTEVALAKPDGYTLLYISLPALATACLDPERKAAYSRKSFAPVAMVTDDTPGVAVGKDSPIMSLKDLIDAAKAKPSEIKVADAGLLGTNHIQVLMLGKLAGVKFASVHFDSGALEMSALLGGHVDAASIMGSSSTQQVRAGQIRMLAISSNEESEFLPGVKTMASLGYKIDIGATQSMFAPAGTSREVVDTLAKAIKTALDSDEYKAKLKNVVLKPRYMDPAQLAAYWQGMETDIAPLIEIAREK